MRILKNRKKTITYAIIVAMLISIFSFPAMGYAESENDVDVPEQQTTTKEATKETTSQDLVEVPETDENDDNAVEQETVKAPIEKEPIEDEVDAKTDKKPAKVKTSPVRQIRSKTVSSKSIRIRWSISPKANGYEIHRYSPKKEKYVLIKTVKAGGERVYKNTNLAPDKKYKYRVRGFRKVDGEKIYGKFSPSITDNTAESANTRGADIVAKAKSRVGSAYRFGASGPNAFDCSGFIYWTYKSSDIATKKKVSRTSSAGMYSSLSKYSVGTSLKKAKKGDIIFFTRGGRIGHSAIYTGNGNIVHAATPAKGVCNGTVKGMKYSGAKVKAIVRVVKN